MQDIRWWVSYPSAEMQSVYFTAPADWATEYSWFELRDFLLLERIAFPLGITAKWNDFSHLHNSQVITFFHTVIPAIVFILCQLADFTYVVSCFNAIST